MDNTRREELMQLLTSLIIAQESVSRVSDRTGPTGDKLRRERIAARNGIKDEILALFDKVRSDK